MDCRPADYHRLDAYASIEPLASQVLDGLAEEPDWLDRLAPSAEAAHEKRQTTTNGIESR